MVQYGRLIHIKELQTHECKKKRLLAEPCEDISMCCRAQNHGPLQLRTTMVLHRRHRAENTPDRGCTGPAPGCTSSAPASQAPPPALITVSVILAHFYIITANVHQPQMF